MASIHKMLNPRSIAIVGATPRMQYGGRFLAAALKAKDRVRVYAVNPRYDEIMGVKSYPSVTNLPEASDVVGIVVPYDQVLDVLQESHRKGTGSAIVISAGFAERGVDDRRDLQEEFLTHFDFFSPTRARETKKTQRSRRRLPPAERKEFKLSVRS
jgi:acyl-CoA synthetase (NDP forming)